MLLINKSSNLIYLYQSSRVAGVEGCDFAHRGHLAMTGDNCGCHNCKNTTTIRRVKAQYPKYPEQLLIKMNYLTQNVNGAKVVKTWSNTKRK